MGLSRLTTCEIDNLLEINELTIYQAPASIGDLIGWELLNVAIKLCQDCMEFRS